MRRQGAKLAARFGGTIRAAKRRLAAGALVGGALAASSCEGPRTGVLVELEIEGQMRAGAALLMSWLDDDRFLFRDQLVMTLPEGARDARAAPQPVGSVFIEVDGAMGERRMIARAMDGTNRVLEAAGRATVARGLEQRVKLKLVPAPLPDFDGDGIPDLVDNCPYAPDGTGGCPRPPTPDGGEAPADDAGAAIPPGPGEPPGRDAGADLSGLAGLDRPPMPPPPLPDAGAQGPRDAGPGGMVPGRDAAPPPPPPPGPDAGPPDTAAPPKPACGPVEGRCPTNLPYDFESGTQSFALAESPTASNLRTTCERTYCGSGALAVDASLSYPGQRIVNVERPLGGQNLVGKTVTAHVYVSSFGAPMNGHVYYIDRGGFWKMVTWKVLQPGWNVISAVVNEATADAVKTLGVSAYLAVDNTKWSGKILVDEIGWK